MKSGFLKIIVLIIVLLMISTSGCAGKSSHPEETIEAYFQALISKEADRLSYLSCSTWESSARTEMDSFTAVTSTLEGLSCQVEETDGEHAIVACSGKIVANYGNEILEIDLSERTYLVSYESGEWRMCGYQ